jgi:hypothetical protein
MTSFRAQKKGGPEISEPPRSVLAKDTPQNNWTAATLPAPFPAKPADLPVENEKR